MYFLLATFLLIFIMQCFQIKSIYKSHKYKKIQIAQLVKSYSKKGFYFHVFIVTFGIIYIIYRMINYGYIFTDYTLRGHSNSIQIMVLSQAMFSLSHVGKVYITDSVCKDFIVIDSRKYMWTKFYSFGWDAYQKNDVEGIESGLSKLRLDIYHQEQSYEDLKLIHKILMKINLVELVGKIENKYFYVKESDKDVVDKYLESILIKDTHDNRIYALKN